VRQHRHLGRVAAGKGQRVGLESALAQDHGADREVGRKRLDRAEHDRVEVDPHRRRGGHRLVKSGDEFVLELG
jgi:hypothetical protein